MTIFVPDITAENKISFNGDFTGWTSYRLQLISNYTNRELENPSFEWLFDLWFVEGNERYTEFTLTTILPVPAAGQYEGFYTYNLYATMDDVSRTEPFIPEDWTVLQTGLTKLQQTGPQENLYRAAYVGPNDDAQSYVIYNS